VEYSVVDTWQRLAVAGFVGSAYSTFPILAVLHKIPISYGVFGGICGVLHLLSQWTQMNRAHYDGAISLSSHTLEGFVRECSHEYAHHVQHSLQPIDFDNPIVEGFAMGVEEAVVGMFADEENNMAFNKNTLATSATKLRHAYIFLCRRRGIVPKKSLLAARVPRHLPWLDKEEKKYVLGHAAMSVAQVKYGAEVYQMVLRGDYQFLEE
jgi:hypothetical protein